MPSSSYLTSQWQAWDQVAKEQFEDECLMDRVQGVNPMECDTLLFGGEVSLALPEVDTDNYTKSTPPWERM